MGAGKALILYLLVFHSFLNTTRSQETKTVPSVSKWSLQQCIEYAKSHNVLISTYRLDQQLAQQDVLLSKAAKLPNLSGAASQSLSRGKNFNSLTGNLQTNTNLSGNYSLNSSVTLYNGSFINNDIRQKVLIEQSGNLTVIQAENDITLQVTQVFLNILLVKENIVYLQDLVNTSAEQVKRQQQLYDAGSIAKKDLVQMQAQFATDKYNLVIAQNAYRQNSLTLKQLLLLSVEETFEISAPDSVAVERMYPDE